MTYQYDALRNCALSGKQMKILHESKCAVIDVLVKEFGEDKVYGGWRSHAGCISHDKQQAFDKIYDVLNFIVFGNSLKKPAIECLSQIEAQTTFGNTQSSQYQFEVKCDVESNNLVGMSIIPNTSKIALVLDEIDAPLMFVVNQLCHAMIHQFIFEAGDGMPQLMQALLDNKQYDVHDGQFAQIMNKLNKDTGLLIEDDYGQMIVSFIESTYKARTMNDDYEGKEELGLYDNMDSFRSDFLDDEQGIMPENENEYIGNSDIANLIQDVLVSSTPLNVQQSSSLTLKISIT